MFTILEELNAELFFVGRVPYLYAVNSCYGVTPLSVKTLLIMNSSMSHLTPVHYFSGYSETPGIVKPWP